MKIIISLLLFITLSACRQNKEVLSSEKDQIRIESVETIHIKKSSVDNDSIRLTEKQVETFIEKWNSSESVGVVKYLPEYWISLKTKSGSLRKFRVTNDKVKENSDWTFSIGDTTFFASLWGTRYTFPKPEQYDPISFINAVSQKINLDSASFIPGMTMTDKFPIDWVKREHIDTLITLINSKDTCGCFLNPLSSYIPNGFSEKGAYAAIFVKAFKDKKEISFGLYACPKIDKQLNDELLEWWSTIKHE